SVSSGKLANVMGTSSRRNWDFFTSDNSTPDNSTAHNSVLQLGVGDTLKWSMSFTLPNGATSNAGNASRDFRIGIYTDPTDARVQTDTNSDSGGATNPWGDALGYGMKIPLNGNLSNTTSLFQIGKRTSSASTTLFGSDSSYTYAPVGGAAQGLSANTSYTAEMVLNEVSATDMKITANFYQGTTLLSTQTVDDLGSSVGGTANIAGSFAAASSIYTKFDQLAFRMSSNTTTSEIDFTNWKVDYTAAVPEPTMIGVICLAGYAMLARRPRRERA
ncbi:MAG TPA: hypothetical protein VLI90_02900, partial [Tepidisphaeraceae bacterium]|nr:hypothetical protein [Tepidisphaeraceae bacterium]